jgi:hypothetical protein
VRKGFPLPPRPGPDPEAMARINAWVAEKNAAPIVTGDAILALLEETRKNARRERWILLVSVAALVALVALVVK